MSLNFMTVSEFLSVPSKPAASISYTFFPAINSSSKSQAKTLVVFVNGLGLPASSWLPTIISLQAQHNDCPAILTYDRFGQGLTTARDPLDGQEGKERGHDFLDVANDLHEIIITIAGEKLDLEKLDVENGKLRLLLVGASIGAPIARLYTQKYPGLVSGLVLLDSNIANMNYTAFFPDPNSPEFDSGSLLSDDCTLSQYIEARIKLGRMFDLHVRNQESLDRSNSPSLLPDSDAPKLAGPGNVGPLVSVVGHDPEKFAEMSYDMIGIPRSMSAIVNRYWAEYNTGLTKITGNGRSKHTIARNCGHFIQKDDPEFVAGTLYSMIMELEW